MGERLLQGPDIYLSLGMASQFSKHDLNDAMSDFTTTYVNVANIRSEVLGDGYLFMADNRTEFGTNYWALGLRSVGKIKVQVQCVGSTPAQQLNTAPFFKSLCKQVKAPQTSS